MTILSNQELIRRVPLFSSLSSAQASMVASSVSKQRFKRGDTVVRQGEKSGHLVILLTGRARVVMTDKKQREVILARLEPGDYVGEMSLIDDLAHSASVIAEVQTDVLILGRAEFAACLPESPPMAYAIMKGLVRRLREADQKIESLALLDVYGRVARALTELSKPSEPGLRLSCAKVSRQDVAKMIGASREMVSRVMKDFEKKGLVETRDDGLMLIRERLSQLH